MKFTKIDLLTLLISLFVFASCEKNSTIGLSIDPSGAVVGKLIDSITVTSRTQQDDVSSTYTKGNGLVRYPLGFLKDPLLGTTESSLSMVINLPRDSFNFGTNPELDSAVLVMNYGGEFYGDSTANYTIDVHQLSNNLSKADNYLSSNIYPHQSQILGTYQGKLFPSTRVKVTDVLTGATDTIANNVPQVRIRLDNNFITNNIVNTPAINRKYNAYFLAWFKGLKVQIRPSEQANLQKGAMAFFNFSSETTSGLFLYYRKQNDNNTALIDTMSVSFPINLSSNAVAASIKHNYSPEVQDQLSHPNTQYSTTYLQPLAGLRNKIAFPYLNKLKSATGKIIVNKAELVVELKSGTDGAPFRAAPRLSLYRYDIAGQRKNVPDNDTGDGYTSAGDPRASSASFGGYFDSTKNRYVFSITAYVQDLIDGKTEDYGTFLSVTPSSSFDFSNTFTVAARASLGSFKKNPLAGDNLIKLNIYYSEIK